MKQSMVTIGFVLIIGVFSVLDLLNPVKAFSEFENRYLATRPSVSVDEIISGDFMKDYEAYVNDQFVLRNTWINLKSINEKLLLKKENNNIVFGDEGYLFDKVFNTPSDIERQLMYLEEFLTMHEDQSITGMIIPNSFSVLSHLRPEGAPFIDQLSMIDDWNERFGFLDINETLLNHNDEAIYYKSDHHWTLRGAYLAYYDLVRSLEIEPVDYNELEISLEDGFLGTYYNRARPLGYEEETLSYFEPDILYYDVYTEQHDSLIDHNAFEIRDKYRAFMHGNIGFASVVMDEIVEDKILIIKDSYANSMIPLMTAHFDQIDVVDLRHFSGSLTALIESEDYDHIVFMQNFMQFSTDATLARLRY